MRTFRELDEHLQGGRDKSRRPLENNTHAVRRGRNAIAVRLHQTDILTFYRDGRVMFHCAGWRSVTTKDRINRINSYAPNNWRVWSDKGNWYLTRAYSGTSYAFHDGMTLTKTGNLRRDDKRKSARVHRQHEEHRKSAARLKSAERRHLKRCEAIQAGLYPLGEMWRDAARAIGEALLNIGDPFRKRAWYRAAVYRFGQIITEAAHSPREVDDDVPADAIDAWHLVRKTNEEGTAFETLYGELPVRKGQTWHVPGHLTMCKVGLHASPTPTAATRYAGGGYDAVCRVKLWGNVQDNGYGKLVGAYRKVLGIALLHPSLRWCTTMGPEFDALVAEALPEVK